MVKVRTVAAILLGAFWALLVVPDASAATFLEIAIAGAPDHGIFDPSVASDGAGKLYMSLSGVASSTPGGTFKTAAVRTYLASSSDQGKSWRLSRVINPDIGVTLGKAPTNGRWQSEVSALVFDAQAPKQARWKLVWHQYLNINGDRKFEHGWIAYKEAESPGALATAKPVKLFTAAAYDAVNDTVTGWTRSPIAGAGVNKVQQLASALQGCIAVSEPGFLSKADALYMSLVCFKAGSAGITNDVVLLKCARPCDAAAPSAWSYAGTVLTPADAGALGLGQFSASGLFSDNGKEYIIVSPEGTTPVANAYQGCNVFRFAAIASGKVERDAYGRPASAASVSLNPGSFNGACTFLPAGVVSPDVQVKVKGDRGSWQSEVSTLTFDPHAPKESRWKVVWHQYLAVKGDRKFAHGWMAYKEAATPGGLAAAKPVKLFVGKGYDKADDDPAGATHTPIPGPAVNKVHKMAGALDDCFFLSEAGMLAKPDALYMSMLCFKPKLLGLLGAHHHVILLKCARPCEATRPGAWSYAGTVLTPDDAEDLDLRKFSASDLFTEGGRDYITVSPVGDAPVPEAYKGCVVFRFADLARGKVERGGGGRPVVTLSAGMNKDSFNGACSFLPEGANKGLLIGRIEFVKNSNGVDAIFHIFRSNISP